MNQSPLLSVRNVKVEIPIGDKFFPAVDGVDFDLDSGEAMAIVGESGCGKTLTARALMNLLPEGSRVSGSVSYRARELLGLGEADWRQIRGRDIAMVFQEPAAALDPVRTVGDQIREAITAHSSSLGRAEIRRRARRLLDEVSLPDPDRVLSEYPHRLSGGQRQRVCLAIALAADPSLLVADEPTTALDATIAAEVLDLVDRLRKERGLALLLITHDLGVVAGHTQRTVVLYAGRVAEEAATEELFREPLHPYTRGLLASAPRRGISRGRLAAIAGVVPDLAFRPRGRCAFAPRCPERFEPCDQSEPRLVSVEATSVRCFLYDRPVALAEAGPPRDDIVPR